MTEVRDDRRENKRECIVRNSFLEAASGLFCGRGGEAKLPSLKSPLPHPPEEQIKEGVES